MTINEFFMLIMAFKGGGWGVGAPGVVGVVAGVILMATCTLPGMGLYSLWAAAVWAFSGGFFVITRGLQQR